MRTMTLRGILTVAVVYLLSVTSASAQSYVSGKVVDTQNQPVEGAVILFKQVDAATKRDTKTNKKGEFIFIGLPTGEYTVTATKGDLKDERKTRISGSDKAVVSFILRPASEISKNPAAANPDATAAAISSSATNADEAEAVKALATAALTAYNAENYKDAIPKFNELVKKLPTCMDCYMYLSVAYFSTAEPEQAEGTLKKAIAIRPSAEAYNMLATLYNQTKRPEQAAEAAKKAAELTAERSATQTRNAQGVEAAERNNAVVEKQNNSASAYNDGVKLWNDKKYPEAKVKFEEAAKTSPDNADAHYMLGMANLNLGQIAAARASFEQYLKVSPNGGKAAEVKGFLKELPK